MLVRPLSPLMFFDPRRAVHGVCLVVLVLMCVSLAYHSMCGPRGWRFYCTKGSHLGSLSTQCGRMKQRKVFLYKRLEALHDMIDEDALSQYTWQTFGHLIPEVVVMRRVGL